MRRPANEAPAGIALSSLARSSDAIVGPHDHTLTVQRAKAASDDDAIDGERRLEHDFSLLSVLADPRPAVAPGTRLEINEAGDLDEREASRVADRVMSAPASSPVAGAPVRIGSAAVQPAGKRRAAPESVYQALASPGRPLEPSVRHDMERRFGHDFSRVQVHSGGLAERSARDVNSHAYTVGNGIVFGAHAYSPQSASGRRLLAHELTHVVQQSSALSVQRDEKGEEFEIHPRAMAHLESLMRRLYEALPREERENLKANGTVAIALVTRKGGSLDEPEYVFTTNNNVTVKGLEEAARDIGVQRYWGDAGIAEERAGPPRVHPPTAGPPPGTGGIGHAEQLLLGHADDQGYVVHGMVVTRRLCRDCPLVITKYNRGRLTVTVMTDPDKTIKGRRAKGSSEEGGKTPAKTGAGEEGAKSPAKGAATEQGSEAPTKKPPAPSAKKPPAPTPKKPATSKKPTKATDTTPSKPPTSKKPTKASAPVSSPTPSGTTTTSSAISSTARRAYSGLTGQLKGEFTRIASEHPMDKDLANVLDGMDALQDADAFLKNPKQFGAQLLTDYLIDGVFNEFATQLAAAEQKFLATYPEVTDLHREPVVDGMSLTELRARYDEASRQLRLPSARKTLVTVFFMFGITDDTPRAEIDRRKAAINAYLATQPGIGQYVKQYDDAKAKYSLGMVKVKFRMDGLIYQLEQLPARFADDLRARGDVLHKVSGILKRYADKVQVLTALPGADTLWYLLNKLSERFGGLGSGLYAFARRAGARTNEYEQEGGKLETQGVHLESVSAFDMLFRG